MNRIFAAVNDFFFERGRIERGQLLRTNLDIVHLQEQSVTGMERQTSTDRNLAAFQPVSLIPRFPIVSRGEGRGFGKNTHT